jgi:hypothetical protein
MIRALPVVNRWPARATRALVTCGRGLLLSALVLWTASPAAGQVVGVYTELPLGTPINLTADGTTDWVKWGVNGGGPGWTAVAKSGVPPLISRGLAPLGTPPANTNVVLTGIANAILNFTWTDGTGPAAGASNTIVTETILPAQFDYPIGLGAAMTVPAAANSRTLDVYVQGFNADIVITATLSGGASSSVQVAPTKNPPGDPLQNYSGGRYTVTFAGAGQTLTVTVRTVTLRRGSVGFPNAGFFGAALREDAGPSDLPPPTNFAAQTFNLAVLLTWTASAGATSYQLEVGSSSGQSDLFVGDIGGGTRFETTGPPGTYYARLRARAGSMLSPPSNEVVFTLGSSEPCAPPDAPTNLTFNKSGTSLTLTWTAGARATSYRLVAGTSPGSNNAFDGNLGNATSQTFNVVGIPAGTYFVRVISVNACGSSAASNEVAVPLP